MKVTSKQEAWNKVNEIFPTDYVKDEHSSSRAGYPVYRSTAEGHHCDYICDLGDRLEVNLDSSHLETVNIWIEQPIQEPTQELSDERKKLAKRLQRVTFWFTGEYVKELANKEKERGWPVKILRWLGGKAPWSAGRKWPAGPRRYRERSACQPDTNSGGTTDKFCSP